MSLDIEKPFFLDLGKTPCELFSGAYLKDLIRRVFRIANDYGLRNIRLGDVEFIYNERLKCYEIMSKIEKVNGASTASRNVQPKFPEETEEK